jgi:hypothetical protein
MIQSISQILNNTLWGLGRLKDMAVYGVASVAVRWAFITLFLFLGFSLMGIIYGWIAGDLTLLTLLSISLKSVNL